MKKLNFPPIHLCVILLAGLAGCARLDSNFFNPNTKKITEYKFDDYTGNVDFRLDASYKIPDSLIHLMTLASQAPGESSPTKIYAVYIGSISSIYAIAGVPKKNSSCIEPHTAVVACCADGSAAEQTPTTWEELGNENK